MIRPFVLQAAQFRLTWLVIGLLVGTMIVATAFALANVPRFGQPSGGPATLTQQHPGYGIGYPRYGLAGPSFAQLQLHQHPGYGTGYPQRYGLAGPSWAQLGPQHPGYGTGYPLHGGLAGPSWVNVAGE